MKSEKQKIQDNFEKQLLQSKLEIQEETFNAISQEIHDNVGQMLSLARIQLSIIAQQQAAEIPGLVQVKETVGNALTDLRNIAKSLSNERLQLRSLPESINEEVERLHKASSLQIFFKIEGQERDLNKQAKVILFRIVQEALQNILKHANAGQVQIVFSYLPEQMQISIADNGIGFNVENQRTQLKGLGLQNILNRAALIGGAANIHSSIDQGTTITISINTPYA